MRFWRYFARAKSTAIGVSIRRSERRPLAGNHRIPADKQPSARDYPPLERLNQSTTLRNTGGAWRRPSR
jgi:hypothetical protein